MKKRLVCIITIFLLFILIPANSFASNISNDISKNSVNYINNEYNDGWVKQNENTYYYKNGKPLIGLQKIAGYEYYFDATGIMQTGIIGMNFTYSYYDKNGHKISWVDLFKKYISEKL